MTDHTRPIPDLIAFDVRRVAGRLGASVESVLLAAHAVVQRALTGESTVISGLHVAGTHLPARIDLGRATWTELISVIESREPAGGPAPKVTVHIRGDLDEIRVTGDAPADELERVAGYHLAALVDAAADPRREHRASPLLSPAERHRQLNDMAGAHRPLPDRRFHELFEDRVAAHPDRVAAEHLGATVTYGELNHRANRVAHALLRRGLGREDVVAVVLERDLDWLAAVLGVFKAGAAYLPVEPHFPADRIATMLARSGARLAVTAPGADTTLRRAADTCEVAVGDVAGLLAEPDADHDPGVGVSADQLAYIYFTSGSTGEPKGAMCEQAGMLNHLLAKVEDLRIGPGTVVAQTAPQCFDISLWQLVAPLLVGGRTLIVAQDTVLDADRFLDTIVDGGVEIAQLVPSYLEVVLSSLDRRPRDLGRLRCVSVTGEAVKKELVARWFATCPGIALVNAYGLTETSDDTNHEVMREVPAEDRVPLGRPVRNVRIYVVDEDLAPVPLGAPGEIVFSGVCVGRGYVNDDERTRAVFLPDPYRPGQRLYRSGDFGRWLPDGRLEFLGRRDAQVKIRGFRIEIGEIENHLLRVAGVRDAAVVVVDDHLVAHYAADAALPGDDLRGALAAGLPEYMVPTWFHHHAALPVTGNGKIDKKGLAARSSTPVRQAGDAPRTDTERALAATWAEALAVPVDQVSRDHHFFESGGTSLAAVRMLVKLDRRVSLAELTGHPVLADLAELIDSDRGATRAR